MSTHNSSTPSDPEDPRLPGSFDEENAVEDLLNFAMDVDDQDAPSQALELVVHDNVQAKTTQLVLRRRHPYDNNEQEDNQGININPKRVAVSVPGPSQRRLDTMSEREEISWKKVLSHAIQLKAQENELRILRTQHEEEKRRRSVDQEMETQMTEQILQYEKQIESLNDANKRLVELVEQGQQQMITLNSKCEDMSNIMTQILAENQREKANRDNEILGLRQRLQAATEGNASVSGSPFPTQNRSKPNRYQFIRGERPNIGVVPLRPAASSSAEREPEQELDDPALNAPIDLSTQDSKIIRAIVKATFDEMNAKVTVSESGKRRASRRTKNQRIIQEQEKTLPRRHALAWKEVVRNFWKRQFKVDSIDDFAQYTPASSELVERFETGQNGPDSGNLLDFGTGFEDSRWNKVILKRLVQEILEERANDQSWDISDVSNDYILALFYGQLKRSRDAWRLVQSRPNVQEGRMETPEEVANRIGEYTNHRLAIVTSRSRRERKLERRKETVEKVISIKSASNDPDLATWMYFRDLLIKLSVDGMSSEEEGVAQLGNIHVPVFRVKLCIWRKPVVRDYLVYIDKETQNEAIRSKRGSTCNLRIPSDEPGSTQAPKKLPVCLYESEWLKKEEESKGKEWVEEELQVSREVFELLEFVAQ